MDENKMACKTPLEDLRESALSHYREASSKMCHWSSFVESAIMAYNPEENKSNDSFQWSWDEIVSVIKSQCDGTYSEDRYNWNFVGEDAPAKLLIALQQFKQSHTPKPQAENMGYNAVSFNMPKSRPQAENKPVAVYYGRPSEKEDFEADVKKAVSYYGNNILCEECGEIGKHKKTCSKENKPDWEIVEMVDERINRKHKQDDYCELNNCKIHSVKRLSDGEVFSVGDEVVHKTDGLINTAKILKFIIPETIKNKMWFEFEEGKDYVKDLANFDKLPPQPQKLSEDKSVCKSDSGHCVNSNVCQELDKCMYIDRAEKSKPQEQRIEDRTPYDKFEAGVESVINKNSIENKSDTPDYISAKFIRDVMEAFDKAILERTRWYKPMLDERKYSQQQVDELCEDAFLNGRQMARDMWKFKAYSDYKQNQKQ